MTSISDTRDPRYTPPSRQPDTPIMKTSVKTSHYYRPGKREMSDVLIIGCDIQKCSYPRRKSHKSVVKKVSNLHKIEWFFFVIYFQQPLLTLVRINTYSNMSSQIERTIYQKPLFDVIQEGKFTPRYSLNQSNGFKEYETPEHQRFSAWKLSQKQSLVDSVLNNWPIHAIILSKHIKIDSNNVPFQYFNIQDGQTRLGALHEFLYGKYTTIDGKMFSDLSQEQQYQFRNYQLSIEVLSMPNVAENDKQILLANIFGRLNSGTPLNNNDKFYSQNKTPIVEYALNFPRIDEYKELFKKYIGNVGSGKTRNLVSDMVGGILSIINCSESSLNTSYELNYNSIYQKVQDDNKIAVQTFFSAYFKFLDNSIGKLTKIPNKGPKKYGKLSGVFGLVICSWIQFGEIHKSLERYVIQLFYDSGFDPHGFADLSVGDRRNCQGKSIHNRLDKIILHYENADKDLPKPEIDNIGESDCDTVIDKPLIISNGPFEVTHESDETEIEQQYRL